MKQIIFIALFFSFVSCVKDETSTIVKPMPYDSCNKKLMGDWIHRTWDNSGSHTIRNYRIDYDSIMIKHYLSTNPNDYSLQTIIKPYKFISNDSIQWTYKNVNAQGDTLTWYIKKKVHFYSKDSIMIEKFDMDNFGLFINVPLIR